MSCTNVTKQTDILLDLNQQTPKTQLKDIKQPKIACLMVISEKENFKSEEFISFSKKKTNGFEEILLRDTCQKVTLFHFFVAIGYNKFSQISDTTFSFVGYPVFLDKEMCYEKQILLKRHDSTYYVFDAIFTFPHVDSTIAINNFRKVQREYPIFIEKIKRTNNDGSPEIYTNEFNLPVEEIAEMLMYAYFEGCLSCKNLHDSLPQIADNECGPSYYSQKAIISIFEREDKKVIRPKK